MKSFKAYYPEHKVLEEKNWAKMALSLMGAGLAAAHGQQAYSNHTPAYSQPATTTALKVSDNEIFKQLVKHEGYKQHVYKDTKGIPTVGIGFNLNDKNNQRLLVKYGITSKDLKKGLSDIQIKQLYKESVSKAIKDAKLFVSNFDKLPSNVQLAFIDLSFNLGSHKLNQFVKFKNALLANNYKLAAHHLKDSAWYNQVGHRGIDLVNKIKNAS